MPSRRNLLQRLATRAAVPTTTTGNKPTPKAGLGMALANPTGTGRAGAPRAANVTIQYASPGQPQYMEWDGRLAVDNAYFQSVWVMRCVRTIADTIAALPFRAGADIENPNSWDPNAPLARLLGPAPAGKPNQVTASRALWAWSIVQRLVTGRMAWEQTRDPGSGAINGLWPLVSAALLPIPALGKAQWWDSFLYQTPYGDLPLKTDQVFYSWRPSARDWRQPESALEAARLPVSIEVGMQRHLWNMLQRGMTSPYMVVTPPFGEDDERRAWQDSFLQEFTGFDNSGKVIFGEVEAYDGQTVPSIQVEKLGLSMVDAQLNELWQQAKIDITVALGVPESLIGNASQRTYANADSEYRNYWTVTVPHVIRELQDDVNTYLAPLLGDDMGWFDVSNVAALQPPSIFGPIALKDAIDSGVVTAGQAANLIGVTAAAAAGEDVDTAPIGEESSKVGARAVATGADLADKVHGYLARSYPPHVLDWVHDADWSGPKKVPLSAIQMDRRPGGRDLEKVDGMAAAVKAGKAMDPVVLVDAPGSDKLRVADGYHRTLAHRRAGRSHVVAYVGKVDDAHGPWERDMHDAKMNRAMEQLADQLADADALEQRYDVSPLGTGKNWVTDVGGLPLFIRAIAHALIRSGHPEADAIQTAVGAVRRWAAGGGKVSAKTQAKAAAAIAAWEAKKKAAKATRALRPAPAPPDWLPAHWAASRDTGPVTEGGSAGLLLPVGQPKPPKPRQARLEGPHAFRGGDPDSCAACGKPATDPVHREPRGQRHRGPDGHAHVPTGHTAGKPDRLRTTRKAAIAQAQDDLTPAWARTVGKVFVQQRQATVNRLTGKRGQRMVRDLLATRADPPPDQPPPPEGAPAGPDVAAIFDTAYWNQRLADALLPLYTAVSGAARGQVLGQLGVTLPSPDMPADVESVSKQAVQQLLAGRANLLAGQVNDTTFRAIQQALADGVADGEPIDQLARRVRQVFADATKVRAQTIARTEVVGAMNAAAHTYASNLAPGVVGGKEWLAHHDERTRPTHAEADGQVRPLASTFEVGGWPMMHPGDGNVAPPSETINCRCGVAYLSPAEFQRKQLAGGAAA